MGTIVAWGWDEWEQGETGVPSGKFVQVATGWMHSVGLRADGTLEAWGNPAIISGRTLLNPPEGDDFVAIAAGYTHSMALRADGTVECWGWDFDGETQPPSILQGSFVAIACGEKWSLGLLDNGTLIAWGGQTPTCGDSASYSGGCTHPNVCKKCGTECISQGYQVTAVPDPDEGHFFIAISATGHFGLALQDNLILKAWGADDYCQVTDVYTDNVIEFAAGHKHGLVLDGNGDLVMWGNNAFAQSQMSEWTGLCTQGPTPYQVCPPGCCTTGGCASAPCFRQPPDPFPTNILRPKGGYYHTTIQLDDGSLVAWGRNANPAQQCITPAGSFTIFSSSYDHGLAIELDDVDSYLNCDGSTTQPVINFDDILCFLSEDAAQNSYADCNGDSQLDAFDYTCFFSRYSRATSY